MLILLFGISAIILAVGIIIYKVFGEKMYQKDIEWIYWVINIVGTVGCAVVAIAALIVGITYSHHRIIDQRIEMYETENQQIEERISTAVDGYMTYESDTFDKCDHEDALGLITLFPELKSDSLISKQIDAYMENNKQIKVLKEEKLSYRVYAWWLFFGGDEDG